ncbi:PRC-barrel domain-containing protein [Pedobacter antarcticus]|uniref:PRC-barrel domain-containing protein n=1 Tax=Pedobacter antarcticus TaxID=34086 RepID=UPI00292CEA8E|nr:PRC-barrel domain-containing protein [Pedobacter antarcticus]
MTAAENYEYRRLESITGSDFEVADGDPNIKGWEIKDLLGERLGEVDDLLFSPAAMKVRYLVAKFDAVAVVDEPKKILIPIGLAELHESADLVFIPGISIAQLNAAPVYDPDQFIPEDENLVLQTFRTERDLVAGFDEERLYEHSHYDLQNLYGRRFPDRGRTV